MMNLSARDKQVLDILRANVLTCLFFESLSQHKTIEIEDNDLIVEMEKENRNWFDLKELCSSLPESVGTKQLLSLVIMSVKVAFSSKRMSLRTEQAVIYLATEAVIRYWNGTGTLEDVKMPITIDDVMLSVRKAYDLAVRLKLIKGETHGNG